MKNLSKQSFDPVYEIFFCLFYAAILGFLSGFSLFCVDLTQERTLIMFGGLLGLLSVAIVYTSEYKPATLLFALILPLITMSTNLRLEINTGTGESIFTALDKSLFFLRGFVLFSLLGIFAAFIHHGKKLIEEDKGYGGPPE
jgi:hypothetical protein